MISELTADDLDSDDLEPHTKCEYCDKSDSTEETPLYICDCCHRYYHENCTVHTNKPFEGAFSPNSDLLCPECTSLKHNPNCELNITHNALAHSFRMVKCHWQPAWEPRDTLKEQGFDVDKWERTYRDATPTSTRREQALDFDMTDLDRQIHHRAQQVDMHSYRHLWKKTAYQHRTHKPGSRCAPNTLQLCHHSNSTRTRLQNQYDTPHKQSMPIQPQRQMQSHN